MKTNQLLTLIAVMLLSTANLIGQLTLSPAKIIAGEKVIISYDQQGTVLESEEAIVVNIFQFDNNEFQAVEIPMKFDAGKFTGSFTTDESTKAVLFEVTNEAMDKRDSNDKKGYKTLCYQSDRKTPTAGGYASKAYIVGQLGYVARLERDTEKAFKLLEKEFTHYPASMKNLDYQSLHLNMASSNKNEVSIEAHGENVEQILQNKTATEKELTYAYTFMRIKKDEDGMKKVKSQLIADFPLGSFAAGDVGSSMRSVKDLKEKVAIYEGFIEKFGKDESLNRTKDYMTSVIASEYLKVEDMDNFRKYFSMLDNRMNKAGSLNQRAWMMSGESLEGEAKAPAIGLKLSKESLQLIEAEMKDMASISKTTTQRKYQRNLKNSYAMYADTYALLAYKNGNMEEALKYQTISCENNKFSNGEETQRYGVYFESVNSPEKTEALLADFIEEGKATSMMKEQHKRLYMANNTMSSAYDKYVIQLGKSALQKKREELKEKMIEMAAPGFDLVNLDGSQVNLKDLKGKVVVVDFWATWCGPCISSFPGMQKAVNKFEQSDDVVFVFIDTWESGKDITGKVAKFIETSNYTFDVLMDLDGKVVSSYDVSGIPTKFVIDKDGVIRFKSVGYQGSDEALVNEMTIMIELAGGTLPTTKTLKP